MGNKPNPGACEPLPAGKYNVVAKMRDIWDKPGDQNGFFYNGNEHLGVHQAQLHIHRLPNDSVELTPIDWYEFSSAPLKCRSPDKGLGCTEHPNGLNKTVFAETDFISLMVLKWPPINGQNGGPYLGDTYGSVLFSTVSPYFSESRDQDNETVEYFHIVNHSYGLAGPVLGARIDTGLLDDTPGLYQFSVEAKDQAGNPVVAHRFAVIDNGSDPSLIDLMIRDNPDDIGAIPSNLGGKKFYRSPDIKVADVDDLSPDDPIWDQEQSVEFDPDIPVKLWVRVTNRGCEDVSSLSVAVAETHYALIASDWKYLDPNNPQTLVNLGQPLAPGESTVVGFTWIPQTLGHRCLLAAVTLDPDPGTTSLDPEGVVDFSTLNGPDKIFTPFDNNLAQRNVKVIGSATQFPMGNPFDEAITLGVGFECNEFPIFTAGAVAELVVEYDAALAFAWSDVPYTTLLDTGDELRLRFHTCKVRLPDVTVPALTPLLADMHLELPEGAVGTYVVDLTGYVNGKEYGGASFFIEGVEPG